MLVPEQVEKIMLDTGAVFVNGSLIAPCEGDNTFVVSVNIGISHTTEHPARPRDSRGLSVRTQLTVRPKGLTQAMLKMALPAITRMEQHWKVVVADSSRMPRTSILLSL